MRTPPEEVCWRNSFEAKVDSVEPITGCLSADLPAAVRRLTERRWRFEVLGNLVTFNRCLKALKRVGVGAESGDSLLNLIIEAPRRSGCCSDSGLEMQTEKELESGPRRTSAARSAAVEVVPKESGDGARILAGCNEGQRAAALGAAAGRLTLLHGPPGTGKVRAVPKSDS